MKDILYRKIFKVLNEDLNMILSDDDFEEPEIDLGTHIQNIQNDINQKILISRVNAIIQNTALSDIINNEWDVSKVTDMSRMFKNSMFTGDISKWNVSSVTDMNDMFGKSRFNGDISGWNVSNVIDMSYMFDSSKFNGDISGWDVSNVQDIKWMFHNSKFNLDISKWNISFKHTKYIFYNCPIKEEYQPK